ncbi:HAD family hydrolase [Gordonia sp. TBRC 11910]|uniref:HAD family hydrolase n=2 Tax=Gordonia asplenii TaxID=2725283 RepID=A0A848KZ25_9ACTN|nr:HAD family hydrolase [Gordonia asplenii]
MIYSRNAMGEKQFANVDPVCVEIYDDAPLSYMARAALTRLTSLAQQVSVVPTTTRTPAQFTRINLPGGPFRFVVTSNGGAILADGVRDPQWDSHIAARTAADGASLAEVTSALRARIPTDGWVRKMRIADDLFCYLVVEPDEQPADFLPDWQEYCAAHGWSASQQGRKIYAVPLAVTKSAAVDEVRRRLVADGTLPADHIMLAAGDGWLDNDLLLCADKAIRPCHGELESLGWQAPNLTVTAQSGALAGLEILEWMNTEVLQREYRTEEPDPV